MAKAAEAVKTLKQYVGGGWVELDSSGSLDVTNPATGQVIGTVPLASPAGVDRAVRVAHPVVKVITDYEEITGRTEAKHAVDLKARVSGYLQKDYLHPGNDESKIGAATLSIGFVVYLFWSRRINDEHRLVYQVTNDALIVASCRFHY